MSAADSRITKAIAYVRVSTDEQAANGFGLPAQRAAVQAEAERRGWDLEIVSEPKGASSATLKRPALMAALDRLDRGEAQVLIVSKLDRMSRSVAQGASVIDRAKTKGWDFIALDLGLDTTSPAGEMVANMILAASQYERRMIGVRTKEGLAEVRKAGQRLGRPDSLPEAVVRRILTARAGGLSFAKIAGALNADEVATAQGGAAWHAATVRKVCMGQQAASMA